MDRTKETYNSLIIHVMSNQCVEIIHYDKRTGQVSYTPTDSVNIYTCYDYDLVSLGGIDHLRVILSEATQNHESRISHSTLERTI